MILLISYKLKSSTKDYSSLYNKIKTATSWWHYIDSIWIIKTNDSLNDWNARLHNEMAPDDFLFIVDITNQSRNGWLTKDAWEWFKKNS